MTRSRSNSVKGKIAAKAAGRLVPGIGELIMVAEGAPVAFEAMGKSGAAARSSFEEAHAHAKGRRGGKAIKAGVKGIGVAQWEIAKGAGKTAIAALVAKEAAQAIQNSAFMPRSEAGPQATIEERIWLNGKPYSNLFIPDMDWFWRSIEEGDNQVQTNWKKTPTGAETSYVDGEGNRWSLEFSRLPPRRALRNTGDPRSWRYAATWQLYGQRAFGNPKNPELAPVPVTSWYSRGRYLFQTILAQLLALQRLYWTQHWTSRGPNFYGDHLLLERLYTKSIVKQIDGLGERMVAYFGPESVQADVINAKVQQYVQQVAASTKADPTTADRALLLLENDLQTSIRRAWKANQAAGEENSSLGLDNFLMQLADERDEARYLLGRRTGTSGVQAGKTNPFAFRHPKHNPGRTMPDGTEIFESGVVQLPSGKWFAHLCIRNQLRPSCVKLHEMHRSFPTREKAQDWLDSKIMTPLERLAKEAKPNSRRNLRKPRKNRNA